MCEDCVRIQNNLSQFSLQVSSYGVGTDTLKRYHSNLGSNPTRNTVSCGYFKKYG